MTTTTPIPGAGQTDERALFEAWATTGDQAGPGMHRDDHGDYRDSLVLAWWQAWQAGRAISAGCSEDQIIALVPENKIKEIWAMCAYWGSVENRAVPFARAIIRAALAAAGAPVQQSEPQPISTAPHDGTEVLAWSITGKTWHQVYWKTQENGDWAWVKSFFPRWACRWNEAYSQGQNDFSHWLPIPAAPQAPDQTGDTK